MTTYHIFISHAWKYSEAYEKVVGWLDEAAADGEFKWKNYSVPEHDPLIDPNTTIGKNKLKAMLKNQNDLSAHYNLGIAYHLIGYLINAIQQYEAILVKEPNNIKVLNYLGMAYIQKKQPGKGIKSFEAALNINPSYEEAKINLNNAMAMKKAKKAT
jgi:tetratricopeptide (TPR) repeat protein